MVIEEWSEDVILVNLRPERDMGTELATVDSDVRLRGYCDVVIDFSKVDIVTSASLSKLLKLRNSLAGCGHRLVLCGLAPDTKAIFTVTGLDEVFEFAGGKSATLGRVQLLCDKV